MNNKNIRQILKFPEPRHFGYFILAISFTIGVTSYSFIIFTGGGPFQTGDWLINYSGGFVRRGLLGQTLINVGLSGRNLLWVTFTIQALLYAFVVLFFITLMRKANSNWLTTALICSPAGIAFYGWDPYAFGRKEVYLYLSLIFLSISYNKRLANRRMSLFLLSAGYMLFIFGIFNWEPVFLGYLGVTYLGRKVLKELIQSILMRWFIGITFFGLALISFLINSINSGSLATARQVCISLKHHELNEPKLCSGAIGALGWSLDYTLQSVRDSFPLYLNYIPLAILTCGIAFFLKLNKEMKFIFFLNSVSFIPLFVIVNDYGRWISIIYISNLLIFLTLERETVLYSYEASDSQNLAHGFLPIVYIVAWGIPHYADPSYAFPTVNSLVSSAKFLHHTLAFFGL